MCRRVSRRCATRSAGATTLLTDFEQRLFRQLGVFAGGWSLEAAAAVANLDELATLDGLTSLVDKSLALYRRAARWRQPLHVAGDDP